MEARTMSLAIDAKFTKTGMGTNLVMRVLVDTRMSHDILYYKLFKEMRFYYAHQTPHATQLECFTNQRVRVKRVITF